MNDYFGIELKYPPSSNNLYFNAGKLRVKTKKAKNYEKYAAYMIRGEKASFGSKRLDVIIRVFPPDHRKRDIANVEKILMDSCVKASLFNDDSQIDKLTICRCNVVKEGKVIIIVQECFILGKEQFIDK